MPDSVPPTVIHVVRHHTNDFYDTRDEGLHILDIVMQGWIFLNRVLVQTEIVGIAKIGVYNTHRLALPWL